MPSPAQCLPRSSLREDKWKTAVENNKPDEEKGLKWGSLTPCGQSGETEEGKAKLPEGYYGTICVREEALPGSWVWGCRHSACQSQV